MKKTFVSLISIFFIMLFLIMSVSTVSADYSINVQPGNSSYYPKGSGNVVANGSYELNNCSRPICGIRISVVDTSTKAVSYRGNLLFSAHHMTKKTNYNYLKYLRLTHKNNSSVSCLTKPEMITVSKETSMRSASFIARNTQGITTCYDGTTEFPTFPNLQQGVSAINQNVTSYLQANNHAVVKNLLSAAGFQETDINDKIRILAEPLTAYTYDGTSIAVTASEMAYLSALATGGLNVRPKSAYAGLGGLVNYIHTNIPNAVHYKTINAADSITYGLGNIIGNDAITLGGRATPKI